MVDAIGENNPRDNGAQRIQGGSLRNFDATPIGFCVVRVTTEKSCTLRLGPTR